MHDPVFPPSRRAFLGLSAAALLWPHQAGAQTGAQARAGGLDVISGAAFGTTWRAVAPEGAGLDSLRRDLVALFQDIDRQMSPWRSDSMLSRFNRAPAGRHAADPELVLVAQAALGIAQASGGAFDPTVGPLVARWGFGPITGGAAPDWRAVTAPPGGLAKARDELTLDLCGIAKGYALDRAINLARGAGIGSLLFEIGGEFRALGRHPSGRAWRIAVEHPEPAPGTGPVLQLAGGQAVATSGLETQSYVLGGRTYGHIIDPVARRPADQGLHSVNVLAADAMTADGWATALFAAGHERGRALAQARGISALFLVRSGSAVRQIRSGAIGDAIL